MSVTIDIEKEMRKTLSDYSLDDLAGSFFVLNMWLPNVASPIKLEYLYTALECVAGSLPKDNRINSYYDFKHLCNSLLSILPNFSMMEDYVPEADWGEVKYFHNGEFYRIFYGASLINPYDFYYAYEIIHFGFEEEYAKILDRSSKKELEFCLKIQDAIITKLNQSDSPKSDLKPGHIEIPPEDFWVRANSFIDDFDLDGQFDETLLNRYAHKPDANEGASWQNLDSFASKCLEGNNCFYYFIKSRKRYYPVMPRRYLPILFDTWGDMLKRHFQDIQGIQKKADGIVDIELFKFIHQRSLKDSIFGLITAVNSESKPHSLPFAAAIHSKNSMYLIHIVPLSEYLKDLEGYLEKLSKLLIEAYNCLSVVPLSLMVWSERKTVEFHPNKKGLGIKPTFLVTSPYLSTEMRSYSLPRNFPGVVLSIDQLLGIIDEVEDVEDFANFFEFWEQLNNTTQTIPLNSPLDAFASYRDSHSVLIEGATTPTHLQLDFNWGTEYRFRSLSNFWTKFPPISFMGHPRGWAFPIDSPSNLLNSRSFRGYYYFQTVGKAVFFINTPVTLINPSLGLVVDVFMQSIRDVLEQYSLQISTLSPFTQKNQIQIFCVPSSAVLSSDELRHLRHLVPHESLWMTSITCTKPQEYGIALVFDDKKLTDVFVNAVDRSLQIYLLTNMLEEINTLIHDDQLKDIVNLLVTQRKEKNRFKLLMTPKEVSFPDTVHVVLPEARDFKLADKRIAHIAHDLKISPGEFEGTEAKEKVNSLIKGVVSSVGKLVSDHSLDQAIPILLSNIDALVHEHEMKTVQVKESIEQEVDYDRESRMGADKREFLHDHQTHRYLIEKFVQIRPDGRMELDDDGLRDMLALVERLLNLYAASDALHYETFPTRVTITCEYIATINYTDKLEDMERLYSKERSQLNLGLIGRKDDLPERSVPTEEYLTKLNNMFKRDMGFGLRDVASVGQVLSHWAKSNNEPECQYYCATLDKITAACSEHIRDLDTSLMGAIIDLLTLRSEDLIRIEGDVDAALDIPVWEYGKRITRYAIRPVIRIGDNYYWAPYSVSRAVKLWTGVAHSHKLPVPLDAPQTKQLTRKAHEEIESAMERKCKEIVNRYTVNSKMNVSPHKFDDTISNIGDYDVFAYFENLGVVLAVESKIIDPAFCMKDLRRLQQKIFGREKQDGTFEEGYLQKVEKRHNYLKKGAAGLIAKLGWGKPKSELRIISLFVTQHSYWWTRFPSVTTEVRFIELQMLDDFLQKVVTS